MCEYAQMTEHLSLQESQRPALLLASSKSWEQNGPKKGKYLLNYQSDAFMVLHMACIVSFYWEIGTVLLSQALFLLPSLYIPFPAISEIPFCYVLGNYLVHNISVLCCY